MTAGSALPVLAWQHHLNTDLAGFEEVWADCDFTLDNELSFYCGTGWRASVPFLVLYENGYDNISVYDVSLFQPLVTGLASGLFRMSVCRDHRLHDAVLLFRHGQRIPVPSRDGCSA